MPATYCPVCGYKNEYSATKPRFCGSCGNPFDAAFKRTPVPAVASQPAASTNYPAQYRPPQYGSQSFTPETISLPVLTASAIDVSTDNGSIVKLTEQNLRNMGEVSTERPVNSNVLPADGGSFTSKSAEKYGKVLSEIRAKVDSEQASRKQPKTRRSRSRPE